MPDNAEIELKFETGPVVHAAGPLRPPGSPRSRRRRSGSSRRPTSTPPTSGWPPPARAAAADRRPRRWLAPQAAAGGRLPRRDPGAAWAIRRRARRRCAGSSRSTPAGDGLLPVVRLTTRRTATNLLDAPGRAAGARGRRRHAPPVVDGGGDTVTSWHELEAELVEGDRALLDAVEARLLAAGARAQLLAVQARPCAGGPRPGRPPTPAPALGSAGAALVAYLREQVESLSRRRTRWCGPTRPDAVHQMRVGCRRMRALLAAYRDVLDAERGRAAAGGAALARRGPRRRPRQRGGARPAARGGRELPAELVLGPVERRIVETFATRYRRAHDRALEEMDETPATSRCSTPSTRSSPTPPLGPTRVRAGREVCRARLEDLEAARRGSSREARAQEDADAREHQLHEVRKSAKRARYAAEAAPRCSATRRRPTARR